MGNFMKNKNNIIIFVGFVFQLIALILVFVNMAVMKDKLQGTSLEKYLNDENIARSVCFAMLILSMCMSGIYFINRWNNIDDSSSRSPANGEEHVLTSFSA